MTGFPLTWKGGGLLPEVLPQSRVQVPQPGQWWPGARHHLPSLPVACSVPGTVAVSHVLAYLEAVTGQGPQDERLQTLARSLDPSGQGSEATVDLNTFLVVMRDWIAVCQLHR